MENAGEAPGITLGGKLFTVQPYDQMSVWCADHVKRWMSQTAIDKVLPFEGESNPAYLARLNQELVNTLRVPELMGLFLLPMGSAESDWTPQLAKQTQKFVAGLTGAEERDTYEALTLQLALGFFAAVMRSLRRSQNYLSESLSMLTDNPSPNGAAPTPGRAAVP